jgi:hypothetical protein
VIPRFQRLQRLGGKTRSRRPTLHRPVWPVSRPVWPAPRPVWPVPKVGLTCASRKDQNAPSPRKKQSRVLMSSWPNIRGKELLRIKVISQAVLMS